MDSESTQSGTAGRVLDTVEFDQVSKLVKTHDHYWETTKKADSVATDVIIMDGQNIIIYKRRMS